MTHCRRSTKLSLCLRKRVSDGRSPRYSELRPVYCNRPGRGGSQRTGRSRLFLSSSRDTARHQGARCWELRASDDLARLWKGQGRTNEASQLLQTTHDQFTDGFNTIDLRDATFALP